MREKKQIKTFAFKILYLLRKIFNKCMSSKYRDIYNIYQVNDYLELLDKITLMKDSDHLITHKEDLSKLVYPDFIPSPNFGASCYMNAVIQMFYHIEEFRNLFMNNSSSGQDPTYKTLYDNFKEIMDNYKTSISSKQQLSISTQHTNIINVCFSTSMTLDQDKTNKNKYSNTKFIYENNKLMEEKTDVTSQYIIQIDQSNSTKIIIKEKFLNKQQDANEFILHILYSIEKCLEKSKYSFLTGQYVTKYVCQDKNIKYTNNEFRTLQIEVPSNNSDLNSLLIIPDEDNDDVDKTTGKKVNSPICNNTPIDKFVRSYVIMPETKIVIIQLKRFDFVNKNKITTSITPDREITIDGFKFKLQGCIVHSGGLGSGHYVYVAYDDKSNPYYICNDSDISEVNKINKDNTSDYKYVNMIPTDGYIFYYRRVEFPILTPTSTPQPGGYIQHPISIQNNYYTKYIKYKYKYMNLRNKKN